MKLKLKVWRQRNAKEKGKIVEYNVDSVDEHMSFLEMLDVLNEDLIAKDELPVAFDHDCREGICGSCSLMINGVSHGPQAETTACQLHMRHFKDGDEVFIEPWKAKAFPMIKDCVVDRGAFDRIIQAGGYVSVDTNSAQDANTIPIQKEEADTAFDAATCIGCGACVAACKNSSAMLFVGAKVTHMARLPQGQVERVNRVRNMVDQMDKEGFGNCTNQFECEAVCPKGISRTVISQMNRELAKAGVKE